MYRLHRQYGPACLLDISNKIVPLLISEVAIRGDLCMHPGIYFIEDAKVVWWAHQIRVAPVKRSGLACVSRIRVSHQKNSSNIAYIIGHLHKKRFALTDRTAWACFIVLPM